jgi:nanoRNase/pAp phosphatase (c-di-AMP/oligoRNAs hydrolase)
MLDKDAFEQVFKGMRKNSCVAILVQKNPDPDCIGAAVGLSVLLREKFALKTSIFYHGKISHPQNKAMKNLLHIQMKEASEFILESYEKIVVVDTDLTNTGFASDKLMSASVRIDHHYMDRDQEAEYEDIRFVGSTCSIIWEYLKEYDVDLSVMPDIATALLIGIKTDTIDFTSQTTAELDMIAYRSVLPHVSKESLARICNYTIPKVLFELECKAFTEKILQDGTLISYIGQIDENNRDVISIIADKMIRMDGVETVVIMAIIDSELVASVRSTDDRVEVSSLCAKVFGKEFSGAKDGSGGARIPLGLGTAFDIVKDESVKQGLIKAIIDHYSAKITDLSRQ